ncbi:enoyl-CoA hydratase [Desulfonema ishimotonii]|uniref:Enoyl-CoA hydratase n=1 Tax=Desulfonema ishimotonii TaxID=45657 RepID=A0A401FU92_9BACT|nr:enoyl-CoA hydratase-related protein [Desulfonema ishimotonii]GBC60508.1 enoyl-CoA hydratase [Desulfonema ishimotonii]
MAYENILFDVADGIATITFNRPKALNALNGALLGELSQALDAIDADEDIRVLVLTGAGEKSFVAGADITELATFGPLQAKVFAKQGQSIISKLQGLSIPVIAAVNGFALGGGSEMALACDFIYASENAMFGLPEITLGIIPGFGGTQRLPRLVGANIAKEMIFTGKMVPAAEAKEIGLVNTVCAPDALMEAVMKTAKAISFKGKISLRAAKQAVNNGLATDLATGLNIECDAFAMCMASEDAKEGTSAFLEKRKAKFTGKLK